MTSSDVEFPRPLPEPGPGQAAAGPGTERAPRVSVVIPAWNAAHTLPETLASVFHQTFADYEVLVVDDGSTDTTPDLLGGYGDRIRVLRKANEGRPSTTRNLGVRAARGELIAFLDADDRWQPEKLARQVALFDRNPDLGLVYSAATVIDGEGRTIRMARCPAAGRGRIYGLLSTRNFIIGSSAMARRAAIEAVGYYDESLTSAENWDLWIRIARHWEIDFVPEPLTDYRVHSGNRSARVALRERNIFRILEKNHDPADRSPEGRARRRDAYFNAYYTTLGRGHFERLEMAAAARALWRAFRLKPRLDVARLLAYALLGRRGFLAAQRLRRALGPRRADVAAGESGALPS
jgi:glycosyltransferase involved in cell wall biosynthesis